LAERVTVNVDALWEDTYLRGCGGSYVPALRGMGESFQETVALIADGVDLSTCEYPAAKYLLGDLYAKYIAREDGLKTTELYMQLFKKIYSSIESEGYDSKKSVVNVCRLRDGRLILRDGHKRLAVVKYLGRQPSIEAAVDDLSNIKARCDMLVAEELSASLMREANKPILYQPVEGYSCSGPALESKYHEALEAVTRFADPVKEKLILDVGCCYGYMSLELVKRGAYALGVERDWAKAEIAYSVGNLIGFDWSNPRFLWADIGEYVKRTELHFDCAILLSVMHNMIGENEGRAWEILNMIAEKSDSVILSMSHVTPVRVAGSQYDIPELVSSKTTLKKCEFLGQLHGRFLYGYRKA